MLVKHVCDAEYYHQLFEKDFASVLQKPFWSRVFCHHKYLRVKDHGVTHGYRECHKCGKRKEFWFMDSPWTRHTHTLNQRKFTMLAKLFRFLFHRQKMEFHCNTWGCEFDLEMPESVLPRLNPIKKLRYMNMSKKCVYSHNVQYKHRAFF